MIHKKMMFQNKVLKHVANQIVLPQIFLYKVMIKYFKNGLSLSAEHFIRSKHSLQTYNNNFTFLTLQFSKATWKLF